MTSTPITKSVLIMAPALNIYLDRFPSEIQTMIFREAMVNKKDALNLIAALVPLHINHFSSLYTEALHIRFDLHPCKITEGNMKNIDKLSKTVRASVQDLVLIFSLTETIKEQRLLSCKMNRDNHSITSIETIKKEFITTRINPKPSFLQNLQPFPNIKRLRFESALIGPAAFHQIEGMVTEALKHHQRLERIEVCSNMTDWMWRLLMGDHDDYRKWVRRINAGTGLPGSLTEASTFDGEECWFWEAPVGQTLRWKQAVTVPCQKRKWDELWG